MKIIIIRLVAIPNNIPFNPQKLTNKIERERFNIASKMGAQMSLNNPFACKNNSMGGRIIFKYIIKTIRATEESGRRYSFPTHIQVRGVIQKKYPTQHVATKKNLTI